MSLLLSMGWSLLGTDPHLLALLQTGLFLEAVWSSGSGSKASLASGDGEAGAACPTAPSQLGMCWMGDQGPMWEWMNKHLGSCFSLPFHCPPHGLTEHPQRPCWGCWSNRMKTSVLSWTPACKGSSASGPATAETV